MKGGHRKGQTQLQKQAQRGLRIRNGQQSDIRMKSPSREDALWGASGREQDDTLINTAEEEWTDEEPGPDGDNYFHWEEEATLFSDLLEEATPEANDSKLVALVEGLQKPFTEESHELKREIAKVFVPLVNDVKAIHRSIDETIDIPFGVGLLGVNDAWKAMEKTMGAGVETMQKAHGEHKKRISELLEQLEQEYAHREQLWVNFEESMDELVKPVLEMLQGAPTKMEGIISVIEKQGRVLEKESASAPAEAAAQTLRGILKQLKRL